LDWAQSSWKRWIQVLLFWWLTPILSLGNQRTISDNDFSDSSVNDKCSVLLDRADYSKSKWPGTWHVMKQAFWKDFLILLMVVPYVAARISQPLLVREIILFIQGRSRLPTYAGYLCAIALGIIAALQAMLHQQIHFRCERLGMRIRNFLSSSIYKHLLMINTVALHKTTAAQAINLVANDASKFQEFLCDMSWLLVAPLEASVAFGLIWWNIGLPTLFGYAVLILLVPVQLMFGKLFNRYRTVTMACVDKRVQAISELVNGCQIIKMYNWEKAMEHRIREIRRRELSSIFKASRLRAFNLGLSFASLGLISLATFGGSWLMDQSLQPENIFATLGFFATVRTSVTTALPHLIEKFSEARASVRRIDQFMQLEVLVNKREKVQNTNGEYAIIMENASFSWKDSLCLFNLNLKMKYGTFIGVKGTVGAGKSSLLAAILGEMNLVSGKLQLCIDSISYAPQLSWIFADTIRANILLGKPMNEERYQNVIKACCLDIDLQNFGEVSDLLMVGDKGVNLSGGQKARISLARALYADADLYLIDDPLAAVDPKVAKKIFDQCIGPRSLLREKTRILITHQIHFLVEADQTILLTDGHIDELHIEQTAPTEQPKIITEVDSSVNDDETEWTLNAATTDINSIVKSETTIDGSVKWSVWFELFTAPPLRWFGFLLLIIVMLAAEALYDFTNRWLALWSAKSMEEQRSSYYAYVYLGVTLGTVAVGILRSGYIYYIVLCGSTYFHNRMLKGILYVSLRFFESNPSGRILNRASKDQQVLDELLPFTMIDSMQYLLITLGSITIIGITNSWVLLILIPIGPTLVWFRRFYVRSSRQLKRLESVTRSPIYALFSSSLDGLTSIHAFEVRADFVNMFMERIDTNSRPYFILVAAGSWFGLRLDLMTSSLTLVASVLAVALRHQVDPAAAALSMIYSINLTDTFQWGTRQSAEAENFMTSAERIHEYGQLAPESHRNTNESEVLIQPPDDWPSRGIIEFKNYSFRYRSELDPVLKNLNLRIESKEKIGVIGRTGMIT
jgi:ATP-binding cassette subfamily C (CFTR/MRP) protein 4